MLVASACRAVTGSKEMRQDRKSMIGVFGRRFVTSSNDVKFSLLSLEPAIEQRLG
jgi:hypothetical protein